MTGLPYYRSIAALPPVLPIFPLPGVLLLPRGTLPLNIFEPRYVAMVEDALRGERLIGMIQPDREAEDVGRAHCYQVGCAGRMTQLTETDDGRWLITLTGIARFRRARELACATGGYRMVEPDFAPFANDLGTAAGAGAVDRKTLLDYLRAFFRKKRIDANWEAIEKVDDDSLVTALAMVCPFRPPERQALLEAPDGAALATTLMALLRMASEGDEDDGVRQ